MHTSSNLTDNEVILALAPVTGPALFGPPLPPGFQRVDIAVTPPPPSTPNTLLPSSLSTPGSSSRRVDEPWEWKDATPPGTSYDSCSGVDIELACRLDRRYTQEEIEVMRAEIAEEKYQESLERF